MALATYTDLQASIASFLDRDDLAASIPDFIRLAEADMDRRLRHWRMEVRATTTIAARYNELPDGWLETLRISVDGDGLELLSLAEMLDRAEQYDGVTAQPRFYAHTNGTLEVLPVPDQAYTAQTVFVRRIPKLSATVTTNWVLEEAPDLYLYGSLAHSAPFLQEDARAQVWSSFYEAAMSGLNGASKRGKHSGAGLRMRTGLR